MIRCSKCKKNLNESEFHKDKSRANGHRAWCKTCVKEYTDKNKNKKLEYNRKYYDEHRDHIVDYQKGYYKKNKDKKNEYDRIYQKENKERLREYRREYEKNRYKDDIEYRLRKNLRRRIAYAMRQQNNRKSKSTIDLIGCSYEELRTHIESLFVDGMSWDNYGEWHVDHIKPCASFELAEEEQQKECFCYTNLQPLWAEDNRKKGAKNDT